MVDLPHLDRALFSTACFQYNNYSGPRQPFAVSRNSARLLDSSTPVNKHQNLPLYISEIQQEAT